MVLPEAIHREKWAAFWLSLLVPGAGQLWAGRWSCLAYFGGMAGLLAVLPPSAGRWGALALLGLVSAERAKRGLEVERRGGRSEKGRRRVRSRIIDRSGAGRRIDMEIVLDVPCPVEELWALVSDFGRFVAIDPFHCRAIVLGPELRPGVALALDHNAFGVRFLRFGRLLRWREGIGYAFSDLSAQGGARGFFPHVFDFTVCPSSSEGAGASRLSVRVRGKWTTRWVPKRLGHWWFRYVCREHARLLRSFLA